VFSGALRLCGGFCSAVDLVRRGRAKELLIWREVVVWIASCQATSCGLANGILRSVSRAMEVGHGEEWPCLLFGWSRGALHHTA
jgi:hypothetical protein